MVLSSLIPSGELAATAVQSSTGFEVLQKITDSSFGLDAPLYLHTLTI